MKLDGKTALVAGGAGNLGAQIASALLERGAKVSVLDARPPEVQSLPEGVATYQADLADEAQARGALASISDAVGSVSVLINCAGMIHSEPLLNLTSAAQRTHDVHTFDAVIRSNLTATFVLSALVAEHMAMKRTKGVIVNFSSIAARGNAGQSAYSAAKAGVEAMTRVWAKELGPLGIRVVAIAPGFVGTSSTQAAISESILSDLKRRTPVLRLAKPEEISSAVLFAIENDFVTGTTIAIDGGLVL